LAESLAAVGPWLRWPPPVGVLVTAAGAVVALGQAVASPLLLTGGPAAAALARHWLATTGRRRQSKELATAVAPMVDELIQQLKAGRSLAQAARLATAGAGGTRGEALGPLRSALAAGLGLEAALGHVRTNLPVEVALVVDTLGVLVHRGGPALPSLERLSDTLRSAQWVDHEMRAQAAQATASATVLAGLPAVFIAGLAALDRRMAAFYLFDVLGAACVLTSAGLSYGAWWWMGRIVEDDR
jgi:tight adherence protein B